MSYRRFFIALAGILLGLYTLFFLLVNVAIDPAMELGLREYPWNAQRYKTDVLTTRLLMEQLEEAPHVLVFGTSRSHMINADVIGGPVLNLHNIYGHPRAVLEFLEGLNPAQTANIKRAYYLLDYHTFDESRGYAHTDYAFPLYYRLWELVRNTNLSKLGLALKTVWANLSGRPAFNYRVDLQGARWELGARPFDFSLCPEITRDMAGDQSFSPSTVRLLGKVDAFFASNGIDAVYFTVPLYIDTLRNMSFDLFRKKNALVLEQVDGVYMGLYDAQVSNDPASFRDCRHLTQAALKRYFNRYVKTKNPAILMTRGNAEAFFERYSGIMRTGE